MFYELAVPTWGQEELDALIGRWASERNPDECFGDFVIRAGIIAPVIDSARDFYAA